MSDNSQVDSYIFYSRLRNERVYLFDTVLILSCGFYSNYVIINYSDGRSEQIQLPFSDQITNDEEEKENEEEELPQAVITPPAPPVTPQAPQLELNNDIFENDETDNEDMDEDIDEEPNQENIIEP